MMGTFDPQPSIFHHINIDRGSPDAENPAVERHRPYPNALRVALFRGGPPLDSTRAAVSGPPGRVSAGRHFVASLGARVDREPGPSVVRGVEFGHGSVGEGAPEIRTVW